MLTPPHDHEGGAALALDPQVGLLVHSHLRWDFVWQRPQQILSRLAGTNPVLFVEEPLYLDDVDVPTLDLSTPLDDVWRAVPRLPRALDASYDRAIAMVRELLSTALARPPLAGRFDQLVQWFYTPMAAEEMLGAFDEVGVVYDCMDELAQFRFAPADLGRRERLLLSRADVVFTGGLRLYESKSRHHDDVHFFGCGVDAHHFAAARAPDTPIPADIADLSGPVLGYFGVIDERLDYELIASLAAADPDWTVVMVGPVVKVDPRDLPQAPNIRWLGQRQYVELPAYVKRFDVCLMPFALNESTEYINPTKTLEYMADGRPIVSTPVADVVRNFGDVVRIAGGTDRFVEAVSLAIGEPDAHRLQAGLDRAAESSWASIVERMRSLIAAAISVPAADGPAEAALDELRPADLADARTVSVRASDLGQLAPEAGAEAT